MTAHLSVLIRLSTEFRIVYYHNGKFIDQPETLAHKTADKKTTTINSVKIHDIMKIAAISRP